MNSQVLRHIALPPTLFCYLFLLLSRLYAAPPPSAERELETLVLLAMDRNPRITAARQRMARAVAEHDGVRAFFCPALTAAVGVRDSSGTIPGATRSSGLDDDSVMARLGVELPVRPGAYLSVGLAQRYLTDPDDAYDSLYQSTLGTRLWVPLIKNRGFGEWRAEDLEALETVKAASYDLCDVAQEVRRDVELAYIEVLLARANAEEAVTSAARVRKLLEEAETLVRLKAVPEYQLFTARLEVSLGEEAEQQARQLVETRSIELRELLGATNSVPLQPDSRELVNLASKPWQEPGRTSLEEACSRRGLFRAAASRVRAAAADCRRLKEALKPDVALAMSATWQGENEDDVWGDERILTKDHVGTEVALVWQQPLGHREERAEVASSIAAAQELREELRKARLQIAAEMAAADAQLLSARARLRLVSGAVDQASRALSAEQERFRVGESRSRHVLDAQKDLTTAVRRHNSAAASLLKARSSLRFAIGYEGEPAGQHELDEHTAAAAQGMPGLRKQEEGGDQP